MALAKGSVLGYYRFVVDSPSVWFEMFRCLPKSVSTHVRASVNRCIEMKMLSGDFDSSSFLKSEVWLYNETDYPNSVLLFKGTLENLYKEFFK